MDTEVQENTIEETTEEAKTYTQDEVDALIQSEADKRVTSALKKAEKKKEQAIKEAEKLARMNDEERYQHELELREQAIAEKEKQLALAENKAMASEILAQRGISVKLTSFVLAEDAEAMMDNINLLEEEFKASVKAEVEKRLATSTPKKNLPLDQSISQAEFDKMPLSQQASLYQSNPDLYKKLTQR